VIALHEITPEQAQQFIPLTAAAYPYHILDPSETGEGLILLSRYPIQDYEFFRPFPGSHSNVRAVITMSGAPVTVYAVHFQRPHLVMFPFSYDVSTHDAEVANLRDRLRAETGPVLVLCDCNMSDQSDAYQTLDRLLDDAFREAGQGLGFTFRFHRFLPYMARIDYIWYSDDFVAINVHTWDDSGTSDHRPVVATLSLIKEERPQDE
jgi:vancomycin resistance protein VanJ